MIPLSRCASLVLLCALVALPAAAHYDVVIHGGLLYDGSGAAPRKADVAIADGRIAALGHFADAAAATRTGR